MMSFVAFSCGKGFFKSRPKCTPDKSFLLSGLLRKCNLNNKRYKISISKHHKASAWLYPRCSAIYYSNFIYTTLRDFLMISSLLNDLRRFQRRYLINQLKKIRTKRKKNLHGETPFCELYGMSVRNVGIFLTKFIFQRNITFHLNAM